MSFFKEKFPHDKVFARLFSISTFPSLIFISDGPITQVTVTLSTDNVESRGDTALLKSYHAPLQ